jgi:GNAT superfamily N-acetyltransferase
MSLLRALADFEKLEPPDKDAGQRILADVFQRRKLGLFVAETRVKLIGYALYYFSYSSFLAKPTFYLEDLFVLRPFRGKGIGRELFGRCVEEAVIRDCGRMEWAVLTWNRKAIGFYQQIGARRLDDWYFYRLDRKKLDGMSSKDGHTRSSAAKRLPTP